LGRGFLNTEYRTRDTRTSNTRTRNPEHRTPNTDKGIDYFLNKCNMEYSKRLNTIMGNLARSSKVTSFDGVEELESEVLAHSLVDIGESCNALLNNFLPKLESPSLQEAEIHELLIAIGEELRHIIYHIKEPKFFNYLIE
jgi:hypothetical protein